MTYLMISTENLSTVEFCYSCQAFTVAAMLNRSLQAKSITAKAPVKNGCLQIRLENVSAKNFNAVFSDFANGTIGNSSDRKD